MHIELVHDAFTMTGDRLGTEGELLSYLLVVQPICHQLKNLALALAEHIQPDNIRPLARALCTC